ncbi:MAG: hypothetical protein KatS3mg058_3782 [Roseiflexus sp.]|jgi:hypothetical protein|nr:MAG: hypothetical protein KatS3mg058_3780 [Roseiflexus sp.]GIW02378.1 MAG: hypothetical protein KatS3mg058_3781 [Roseiflexus sp.]GIW02379.1 MAG: hypothetical protein KatS3mg058_3782 [Roseiflexus sp.]
MTSLQKATTKVTKEMLFIFIPFVRFVSFVVKPSCSGLNHSGLNSSFPVNLPS